VKDGVSTGAVGLAGLWRLTDEAGAFSLEMELPGDVLTALERAGHIPDPYWGRNETSVRWVSERDWSLRRQVTLHDTDVVLELDRVDTVAEVRVNGMLLGQVDNAFRGYRFELHSAAQIGRNEIEIRLLSPARAAQDRAARLAYPVPYHADNCPIPHGNLLRKPQCDFGWDWNIALAPMGVLGEVRLRPRAAVQVTGVSVALTCSEREHEVCVRVGAEWPGEAVQPFRIKLGDHIARGQVAAGDAVSVRLPCRDEDLWWPTEWGRTRSMILRSKSGMLV